MTNLNNINSPISREERNKLNENWQLLTQRFSHFQRHLNLLAGEDVEGVITNINERIAETDAALQQIETDLVEVNGAADNANTKAELAQTAADIAEQIAAIAQEKIDFIEEREEDIEFFTSMQNNLQAQVNQLVVSGDSSPEAAQARVDVDDITHSTLKSRIDNDVVKINQKIDSEIGQVTTQLAQKVERLSDIAINVKDFGVVADANYFNDTDNRYYRDSNYTELATDNAEAYLSIYNTLLNYKNVKILFPVGNYYSSTPFEVKAENIEITGVYAKIIKSAPNSISDSNAITTVNCKKLIVQGISIENIIENKTIVNDAVSNNLHTYYHIKSRTNTLEYCRINDCTFIDNVSIPNATDKPFNGILYLGKGKDFYIFNNKFINPAGRIIYISGSQSVHVYDNEMDGVGFVHSDVSNVKVQTLVFRILSSKHVKIHGNTLIGTTMFNAKQQVSQGVFLGMNEQLIDHCDDVYVYNNTFIQNELSLEVFKVSSVKNSILENNNITLNNTNTSLISRFFTMDDVRTESYMQAVDIFVRNNKITNAHSKMFYIYPVFDVSKLLVYFDNNHFDSGAELNAITDYTTSVLFARNGILHFNNNRLTIKGVYDKDVLRMDGFDYNKNPKGETLVINGTNISTYITGGLLNVPSGYKFIEFYGVNNSTFSITDIQIDGKYLDGKELVLRHTGGTYAPLIQNGGKLRMPNGVPLQIRPFTTVSLRYTSNGNYWVTSSVFTENFSGTTANRPTNISVGTPYFDTTLNKPIWWSGSNWRDSNGNIV